jgi:hypothetical protein
MAVQKHNTYYDNELYYYDENGVRKPLQLGKVYSAGSGIKIENNIISVSGKYVASADPSLDGKSLVLKDNKWEELILPPSSDWLPTIKEASANAVSTVEGKFGLDEYNQISSYNNTPFANDKYHAGYGLDLDSSTNTFSAKKGLFALSADVYNKDEIDGKIETLEQELAKLGFYVCNHNEIDNNGVPNDTVLDSEGKLSTSKVYLVKVATAPTPDQYKEWIWDGSVWTCIGDTTMNLSGYATEDWVKNNFLSANALDLIASVSSQWNDVSSKLNTSAFNVWSAQADITPYTGIDPIKVEGHDISLTADYLSANALDEIKNTSAKWNSVYETVKTTSSDWNDVSSKADQSDLDNLSGKVETLSGKVETLSSELETTSDKVETLSSELESTSSFLNENIESLSGELESTNSFLSGAIDVVSAEFEKVVYTSATNDWDVTPYIPGENIDITNHTISSKDWTNEINNASANAVNVVKSKFNETQNGEFSGYDDTPFYVKQNTISGTSPILVTKQGDEYNIAFEQEYKRFIEEVSAKLYTSALPTVSSLTPDYLKVDLVENQDGTSAWRLSAAEQKNYKAGNYIYFDEDDYINVSGLYNVTLSSTNESIGIIATTGENGDVNFNLSANIPTIPGISGINGLSGYYNSTNNKYYIGIDGDFYSASNPSGFINSAQAETQILAKKYITSSVGELDNFYSKTQTSGADEIANAIKDFVDTDLLETTSGELKTWVSTNYYDKTNTSSKTELQTKFGNLEDTKLDITAAAQTYQPKGDYLSANALNSLSGKWETVEDKLDTTAFSNVSGTFLTAHQSLEDYATIANLESTSAEITAMIPTDLFTQTSADTLYQPIGDYYSATNPSGFIDGLAVLDYDVSTWQDFLDAYRKNKVILCRVKSGNTGYRHGFVAWIDGTPENPTQVQFQYYRNVNPHSASQQTDELYVYVLNSNSTWTTSKRNTGTQIIAGDGLSSTFVASSCKLTLSVSGDYVTSSNLVDDEQYTLTTSGWSALTIPDTLCAGSGVEIVSNEINALLGTDLAFNSTTSAIQINTDGTAYGSHAFVEGTNTTASGNGAHAEGADAGAYGQGSHAGGYGTHTTGVGNFIHGTFLNFASPDGTSVSNTPVFVGGTLNAITAQDYTNHGGYLQIMGNGTYVGAGQGNNSDAYILYRDGTVSAKQFQNADGTETINGTPYNFSGVDNIEILPLAATANTANFPNDNVLRFILES